MAAEIGIVGGDENNNINANKNDKSRSLINDCKVLRLPRKRPSKGL